MALWKLKPRQLRSHVLVFAPRNEGKFFLSRDISNNKNFKERGIPNKVAHFVTLTSRYTIVNFWNSKNHHWYKKCPYLYLKALVSPFWMVRGSTDGRTDGWGCKHNVIWFHSYAFGAPRAELRYRWMELLVGLTVELLAKELCISYLKVRIKRSLLRPTG